MKTRHLQALAAHLALIEDPSARENAVCEAIIDARREARTFNGDRFRGMVDSERTKLVATRVAAQARASRRAA